MQKPKQSAQAGQGAVHFDAYLSVMPKRIYFHA